MPKTEMHSSPAGPEARLHALMSQFEAQTLTAADWTHEAHLWVAFGHLLRHAFYDACCRMKAGIILLNQVHGTPNHGGRGYHETLTFFWMHVLHLWRERQSEAGLPEAFGERFLHSGLASAQLPLAFYGREALGDPALRAFAQPPHLRPLDWPSLEALA